MAPAGNLSHPVSARAVSVVLILLSASAGGERQCSWCGPLAEQVHRSQRAPSCDDPGVTTCDDGFPHCAIVATSPPYVESRLCVKLYQDECYSIFCNSSRTWRMTCPCRGDLCNKKKTEREDEAFAFLATLGSKIQNLRIKKRTVTHAKFISRTENKTIVNNEDNYNDGNTDIRLNDKDISQVENNNVMETEIKGPDDVMPTNNNVFNASKNDINNEGSTNYMTSAIPTVENDNKKTTINADDDKNMNINAYVAASTNSPNVGSVVNDMPRPTEISVSTTQSEPKEELPRSLVETTVETQHKDINVDVDNNIDRAAEIPATEKNIDEKISMKPDLKPNAAMPTAEALQQNSSPSVVTEKSQPITDQTTETTVMMTTRGQDHITATPDPMKMKKNNAVVKSLHYSLISFWVILYFI